MCHRIKRFYSYWTSLYAFCLYIWHRCTAWNCDMAHSWWRNSPSVKINWRFISQSQNVIFVSIVSDGLITKLIFDLQQSQNLVPVSLLANRGNRSSWVGVALGKCRLFVGYRQSVCFTVCATWPQCCRLLCGPWTTTSFVDLRRRLVFEKWRCNGLRNSSVKAHIWAVWWETQNWSRAK